MASWMSTTVAVAAISLGGGCATEWQAALCGAGACGAVGSYATYATTRATAYDVTLRDDDGRLVPVADQAPNLMPVAIGIGTATVLVTGSLLAVGLLGAFVDPDAPRSAPAPVPEANLPKHAPEADAVVDDRAPVRDDGTSTPVGDQPPPLSR